MSIDGYDNDFDQATQLYLDTLTAAMHRLVQPDEGMVPAGHLGAGRHHGRIRRLPTAQRPLADR